MHAEGVNNASGEGRKVGTGQEGYGCVRDLGQLDHHEVGQHTDVLPRGIEMQRKNTSRIRTNWEGKLALCGCCWLSLSQTQLPLAAGACLKKNPKRQPGGECNQNIMTRIVLGTLTHSYFE